MVSIESQYSSSNILGSKTIDEVFFNSVGTATIGMSFFTGPLLIGIAHLIEIKEKN